MTAGTRGYGEGEPGTAGRRERKREVTRAAIQAAALRLALRDGVEKVTLDQITTEADIARRTFFNYFASKEAAVVASAASGFHAYIDQFRARPRTESVLQALREAALVALDRAVADDQDQITAFMVIRSERSLVPQLLTALAAQEAALADAIVERLDPAMAGSVYPRLCAAATLAGLRVALDQWLCDATPDGLPSFAGLRSGIDQVMGELAAGLDRPGTQA